MKNHYCFLFLAHINWTKNHKSTFQLAENIIHSQHGECLFFLQLPNNVYIYYPESCRPKLFPRKASILKARFTNTRIHQIPSIYNFKSIDSPILKYEKFKAESFENKIVRYEADVWVCFSELGGFYSNSPITVFQISINNVCWK